MGYLRITVLGFALSALSGSLGSLILPVRVLDIASESQRNTYLGLLIWAGLTIAVVVQPLAGAVSDQNRPTRGRRRPFILAGVTLSVLLLPPLVTAGSYAILFVVYCLFQIGTNTAQAAWQGLIPDLVPERSRGKTSGVKLLLEATGVVAGLQLVGYFFSERFAGNELARVWLPVGLLSGLLTATMLVTLTIKEPRAVTHERLVFPSPRRAFRMDARTDPRLVRFLVSRLFFLAPLSMLRIFGLYILEDVVRIRDPAAAVADLTGVVLVGLLAAAYPVGRLSDRIGRRRIVLGSGCMGALAISILWFSHSYFSVMLVGALLGIASGAFLSVNWAMATDLVAKGEEARYLGLTNIATAGASAVAGLAGPVIDVVNALASGLGYQALLGLCILLMVASSVLTAGLRAR